MLFTSPSSSDSSGSSSIIESLVTSGSKRASISESSLASSLHLIRSRRVKFYLAE